MTKLRVLDLFSGIGGFSLGLERTGGFETVAFCEMKPHAQAVLSNNFPGVPCHGDVTTYDFREGEADVITAGFPCQDISFAGDGAGLAGARSGLYREVVRAIRVVRPLFAILENVAALLSRGLDVVLGDVAAVGYDAEWHCIPASAAGAPHRRDRIWIVAHPRGEQHEGHSAPLSGSLAAQLSEAMANSGRHGYGSLDGSGEDTGTPLFCEGERDQRERLWAEPGRGGEVMADPDAERELQPQGSEQDERRRTSNGREDVAHAERFGRSEVEQSIPGRAFGEGAANTAQHPSFPTGRGWWAVEPGLGRVADGVPNRVDRLEELGNAVVPQIPEMIGHAILEQLRAA